MDLFEGSWADIDGPNDCYRWTLARIWDESIKPMLVVGANPSTANAYKNDQTVLRWCHFGKAWGHGGIIAVNKTPYRASKPENCEAWFRQHGGEAAEERRRVHAMNLRVIRDQGVKCSRLVPCWGDILPLVGDAAVQEVLTSLNIETSCFGLTASGNPKHVMARGRSRVPDDQQPVRWCS